MTRHELEQRRMGAVVDIAAGLKISIIASRHGVVPNTVRRWIKRWIAGSIRETKATGRPSRLTHEHKDSLRVQAGLYQEEGRRVTRSEFQDILYMKCGVLYSIEHTTRIGWSLGFSFRGMKL